ncbi:WD repeat-containing protein 86 isoform X2 [Pteropus vampyrus]|uniref:WD repeat-containing protein 86 isoform X2 n=1 Tax=Pteropus vampyrus TaxID=132908 RepID=A0A6P3R7L5_PTEVA|nr:WD repeat-containing protein 86 isoform X2 [Pteropus vampyrus]
MGGGGSALRVCAEHRGGINWLSLSPDGQRLLTGSEDGTARLWSAADGQCCALLQGHESYVTFCQLENEAAFTCSADRTIRKWDVLTGQCLQVFRGHTSIVNRGLKEEQNGTVLRTESRVFLNFSSSLLLLKTPCPPPSQGLNFSLLNLGLCWAVEIPLPIRSNQHYLCNLWWPSQTPEGLPGTSRSLDTRPRALPASLTMRDT